MALNMKLLLTVFVALVLTVLPLPSSLMLYRPALILMLVLYIQCCMPAYFRVTWVFLLGIYLDVLCATSIGQHSLALIVTTWIATTRSSNFSYFSTLQQMSVVLLFSFLYHLIIYLTEIFFGVNASIIPAISSAFISVLFWPCLRLLFSRPLDTEYVGQGSRL